MRLIVPNERGLVPFSSCGRPSYLLSKMTEKLSLIFLAGMANMELDGKLIAISAV